MKKLLLYARRALPVAKFLWANKKAELALAASALALARQVYQIATGR